MSTNASIIFFDGHCNLCQKSVQVLIKMDKKNQFKFSSLQSAFGKRIIEKHDLGHISSVVLSHNEAIYTKSDAILQILKLMGGWKSIFEYFRFIPKSFRDKIYDWIARNRYSWFGKSDECWILTPELKARFIE
jgi:predicted DCC family thiol-disulfide oxidoreductase YuxK